MTIIFSSDGCGENPMYCYSLGIIAVLQKLCHFVMTVVTEDIYLKLGVHVCVRYPRNNPHYQGGQFKMHFFLRIVPLFRLRLFIFYQAPHSRALAPACGALVSGLGLVISNFSFSHNVFYPIIMIIIFYFKCTLKCRLQFF